MPSVRVAVVDPGPSPTVGELLRLCVDAARDAGVLLLPELPTEPGGQVEELAGAAERSAELREKLVRALHGSGAVVATSLVEFGTAGAGLVAVIVSEGGVEARGFAEGAPPGHDWAEPAEDGAPAVVDLPWGRLAAVAGDAGHEDDLGIDVVDHVAPDVVLLPRPGTRERLPRAQVVVARRGDTRGHEVVEVQLPDDAPSPGDAEDAAGHGRATVLRVVRGDITTLEVEAIVNAANRQLAGGGGVDGAIHAAGGPSILTEGRAHVEAHGPLPTGDAVATTAGDLPARRVVHTVGPVWAEHEPGEADALLASCYRRSLDVAAAEGLRTIAFPNVSTGVFGFPKWRAAGIAADAVRAWVGDHPGAMDEVVFCCFDDENERLLRAVLG